MATTTFINKATYDAEYADKSGSSLIFKSEMFDCINYVNTTKLRKKFNLKGRGRVIHVLLRCSNDPNFVNIANKDIIYKNPVLTSENSDGATKTKCGYYATEHPIGDAIVVLKE